MTEALLNRCVFQALTFIVSIDIKSLGLFALFGMDYGFYISAKNWDSFWCILDWALSC